MATRSDQTLIIRNTSRQVLWFVLDSETAEKARKAKIHNVHLDQPLFGLGDVQARPHEIQPQVEAPRWFWDALRSGDTPQARALKGWINKGTISVMGKVS